MWAWEDLPNMFAGECLPKNACDLAGRNIQDMWTVEDILGMWAGGGGTLRPTRHGGHVMRRMDEPRHLQLFLVYQLVPLFNLNQAHSMMTCRKEHIQSSSSTLWDNNSILQTLVCKREFQNSDHKLRYTDSSLLPPPPPKKIYKNISRHGSR